MLWSSTLPPRAETEAMRDFIEGQTGRKIGQQLSLL